MLGWYGRQPAIVGVDDIRRELHPLSNDRPVKRSPRAHTVHLNEGLHPFIAASGAPERRGLKTLYLIGRVPDGLPPDRDAL